LEVNLYKNLCQKQQSAFELGKAFWAISMPKILKGLCKGANLLNFLIV